MLKRLKISDETLNAGPCAVCRMPKMIFLRKEIYHTSSAVTCKECGKWFLASSKKDEYEVAVDAKKKILQNKFIKHQVQLHLQDREKVLFLER